MSNLQKINTFIIGAVQIALAALVISEPQDYSLDVVVSFLGFALSILGIKHLYHYFTMARFMVDGKIILILGVILLDFGILSASLIDVPTIYIIMYLVSIHAFSALVLILRTVESIRYGAKSWKFKLSHGIIEILIVVACFVFIKSPLKVALIYGIGLAYSGLMNIITAFRKSTLIYIQ